MIPSLMSRPGFLRLIQSTVVLVLEVMEEEQLQ
jgi:hypothetical protein